MTTYAVQFIYSPGCDDEDRYIELLDAENEKQALQIVKRVLREKYDYGQFDTEANAEDIEHIVETNRGVVEIFKYGPNAYAVLTKIEKFA